jgi:hypothetical protein
MGDAAMCLDWETAMTRFDWQKVNVEDRAKNNGTEKSNIDFQSNWGDRDDHFEECASVCKAGICKLNAHANSKSRRRKINLSNHPHPISMLSQDFNLIRSDIARLERCLRRKQAQAEATRNELCQRLSRSGYPIPAALANPIKQNG